MISKTIQKDLIKLIDEYIDFIQVECLDTSKEDIIMKETDKVILKFMKLKRQHALDM